MVEDNRATIESIGIGIQLILQQEELLILVGRLTLIHIQSKHKYRLYYNNYKMMGIENRLTKLFITMHITICLMAIGQTLEIHIMRVV